MKKQKKKKKKKKIKELILCYNLRLLQLLST